MNEYHPMIYYMNDIPYYFGILRNGRIEGELIYNLDDEDRGRK